MFNDAFVCLFLCVQEKFPQFSVGDTVCVTIDEERLAQLISKWKEFAQYYSMVIA